MGTKRDDFEDVLAQWETERPDLDLSPILLIGRLSRLGQLIERFYQASVAPFGLAPGDFFVLCELRRAGVPYQLSPSRLSRTLVRSSGGMTKQLDNLEGEGLVRRSRDPDDRRGVVVSLTPKGRKLIDRAMTAHAENEHRLLSPLASADRKRLTDLLREFLGALDASGLESARGSGSCQPRVARSVGAALSPVRASSGNANRVRAKSSRMSAGGSKGAGGKSPGMRDRPIADSRSSRMGGENT